MWSEGGEHGIVLSYAEVESGDMQGGAGRENNGN